MSNNKWTFFTYDHPSQAKDQQTRKKIRGHITRRQHALNRSKQSTDEKNLPPGSFYVRDPKNYAASSSSSEASASSSSTRSVPKTHVSAFRVKQHLQPQQQQPPRTTHRRVPIRWNSDSSDETQSDEEALYYYAANPDYFDYFNYPAVAIVSPTNSVDLNVAPVDQKEWYGWLHDYWFNGTLPKAKHRLKVNDHQLQQYIAWTRSLVVTEPAFYYMSLLLATGIPVSNGQFPLVKALWLRGQTVSAINEALSDPGRMTSDALIQAVGQIALHEHIYGDRAAAHQIHRPAQQRMIEMRGGINNLNLPPEVQQIMVWYDRLMAAEAGNQPYFASLVDGRQVKQYTDTEAVGITNHASPHRDRHPGYYGSDGGAVEELDD